MSQKGKTATNEGNWGKKLEREEALLRIGDGYATNGTRDMRLSERTAKLIMATDDRCSWHRSVQSWHHLPLPTLTRMHGRKPRKGQRTRSHRVTELIRPHFERSRTRCVGGIRQDAADRRMLRITSVYVTLLMRLFCRWSTPCSLSQEDLLFFGQS